jgi:hypothetical protein
MDTMFLRNVVLIPPDYMALYPRKQSSSYPSLWEPQIQIYIITGTCDKPSFIFPVNYNSHSLLTMCHMGNLSHYISVGPTSGTSAWQGSIRPPIELGVLHEGELLLRWQWRGSSRVIAWVSFPETKETSISSNWTFYKWVWVRYIWYLWRLIPVQEIFVLSI